MVLFAEEKQDVEQEQNVNQNLLILFHKNLVNNFFLFEFGQTLLIIKNSLKNI